MGEQELVIGILTVLLQVPFWRQTTCVFLVFRPHNGTAAVCPKKECRQQHNSETRRTTLAAATP